MKINNRALVIIYIFIMYTLIYINNLLIDIDSLIQNSISENLNANELSKYVEKLTKLENISLLVLPIVFIIKIYLISTIINIGCFIFNKKVKFKQLFNIVVKAEFIFLLVIVFKTAWFYFFQDNYTLEDLQYFYPLSAINITGYEGLDPWWVYPLQVFNVFELAYWLVLAYLLGKALHANFDKGISIVASSYGVALLIWVVGVMFFTLNAS